VQFKEQDSNEKLMKITLTQILPKKNLKIERKIKVHKTKKKQKLITQNRKESTPIGKNQATC
jgi:hypothetical protein